MKRPALLAAALLAFTGQTQAVPVRHLEYAFAEYSNATPSHGYFDGILTVDILPPDAAGGTPIRVAESWHYTPRPEQTIECVVFASASVRCDNVPPYPSRSELTVFPLLARDFFSAASPSAAVSWRQKFTYTFLKGQQVDEATLDLSGAPQNDGRSLSVAARGTLVQVRGTYDKQWYEGRFAYDLAAKVPVIVHAMYAPAPTGSPSDVWAVDLQLVKDSDPASAPAIQKLPPPRFSFPP